MMQAAFLERAVAAAQGDSRFNPVVAAAQAALESNFGQSQLAQEANNLKGVKAGSSWSGPTLDLPTKEWRESDGTWYTTIARWRKYPSWEAAFTDYGDLIERVYPFATQWADDPRRFLEALVERDYPKYATDPAYVAKVWGIIERFDMLTEPSRLLLVYGTRGTEVARVVIPAGADIVTRLSDDATRFYVRFEERKVE